MKAFITKAACITLTMIAQVYAGDLVPRQPSSSQQGASEASVSPKLYRDLKFRVRETCMLAQEDREKNRGKIDVLLLEVGHVLTEIDIAQYGHIGNSHAAQSSK